MNLTEAFPYMVCVNLASREDRRREAWKRFSEAGLNVDRQPGIPAQEVGDTRGFHHAPRYACSLGKRLAIRRGKLAGAPAVLLFEDDVVLAPDLHERLAELDLPDDWGIFFLGCKHLERPEPVAPGLVRVCKASDHHAMAVRAEYYDAVIRGLAGYGKGCLRSISYSDVKMSSIQRIIPTYAAYPNLAWQKFNFSDNSGHRKGDYDGQGRQRDCQHAVDGLDLAMARLREASGPMQTEGVDQGADSGNQPIHEDSVPLVAAAGLAGEEDSNAEGDTASGMGSHTKSALNAADAPPDFSYLANSPGKHRLEESFPMRCYINLGRREDRRFEVEYQFAMQGLMVERLHAADGRSVRHMRGHGSANQYACRLSHRLAIRNARQRGAPAVMIFEDDVVFHPDFRRLAETLPPPPDWGVLFYGCTHVEAPEAVAPGIVRIAAVWSLHAYVVRAPWYDTVLRALRAPGNGTLNEGADVILSGLSSLIPMYAVYPNIAWQSVGYSDLQMRERKPFTDHGHQTRNLHVLRQTNAEMRGIIQREYGPVSQGNAVLTPEEVFGTGGRGPLWKFEDVFPQRIYMNLDERTDRRLVMEQQLASQGLAVDRFSSVRAGAEAAGVPLGPGAVGCALSHCQVIEDAIRDNATAVLIFEDDAVFHPRLREWCEATPLPDDWGMLFFGVWHVASPLGVVAPGLVRLGGAYMAHAYAIRRPFMEEVLAAMRAGMKIGKPCDVVLSELHPKIPSYAFYPNLAWQAVGFSDQKKETFRGFDDSGVQLFHRADLFRTDQQMRDYLRRATHGGDKQDTCRGLQSEDVTVRFKSFWRGFDYSQASGTLDPDIDLLFGLLQQSPITVGGVYGHDPVPYDVLLSGECLTGLTHDGTHFVFKDTSTRKWSKTRWFVGTPWIVHPRALHVPHFYCYWARMLATGAMLRQFSSGGREFGVSVVVSNLKNGGLAGHRVAFAHELSRHIPVHGNKQLQAVAPPDSKMIYHDVPDKLEFLTRFTHNLCFENQACPGYLTEKPFESLAMGAVPLYCGDPMVAQWIESGAMIDCSTKCAEEVADLVRNLGELPAYVAAKREQSCLVTLEEMRDRAAAFQRLILDDYHYR